MKVSDQTLLVLKNFAQINQGIMLRAGNTLKTMSTQRDVLAQAEIQETIPRDAGIYDLSRFLSTISLVDDPDIEFGDDKFIINSGNRTIEYTYAAENMLIAPPADKQIELKDVAASFPLSWNELQSAIRAAGILSLDTLSIQCKDQQLKLFVEDRTNPTADKFEVQIDSDHIDEDFKVSIKVDHFKLLPSDYTISITDRFIHLSNGQHQYWIATEAQ